MGAVLYHRLTGRAPFAADTPLATLGLVASAAPARPSEINSAVPRDLDTICLKCLDKDQARRYPSAAELADDLERWRTGVPIAARPARTWELAWRRVRRHPVAAALAVTTLGALVGAVAVLSQSNARIRETEKETHNAYLRESALRSDLEVALVRDRATRRELEETLQREQRSLYLERVTAAGRFYMVNQLPEAWALLDQCPEPFRQWEWRYLDSLRRAKTVAPVAHPGLVSKVGVLADGRLVSADALGDVRTWSAATRECLRRFKFGTTPISGLAVHPTKNWAAVADFNRVAVWDADTGQTVARVAGTQWVAFSPDGTRLATADRTAVRLWTVPETGPKKTADGAARSWEPAGQLTGHAAMVSAGVFTADGKQLVTAAPDQSIRTWDLDTLKQVSARSVPAPVTGLALVSGGAVLAEAHPGAVLFTDRATGQLRDRLEAPTAERAALVSERDGDTVAVGGPNGEVVVWDVAARRTAHVFRGHSGRVTSVAFGPDRRLVSGGSDRVLRLWDRDNDPAVRTLARVSAGEGGLALSPDGARIAVGSRFVGGGGAPHGLLLDTSTGRELLRFEGGPDIGFHKPSGHLVSGRRGTGAVLWDTATGRPIWGRALPGATEPLRAPAPGARQVVVAPDGSMMAIWDRQAGGIRLWSTADGTGSGFLDTDGGFAYALDFSSDGSKLAVATDETVTVWDVAARVRLNWSEAVPGATAVALSPNGRWLATVDPDRTVRLRDAATGREVRRFTGAGRGADVLAFSPDGARLVTGGTDRTVRVWDAESGRELLSLPGVTDAVTGIVWDGPRDRIYALDRAVRVWGAKAN
ncbi:PQQ-binding-like beta-propeller repeat protein [Frigoriglobus tundricola]|uniref:PQQ-binding-like beta-propeller repeat protein n=1 Tax=Frigoriglobus tundricola TaxID=2774151 RepID=UPI00148ED09E|nr:PQQ-binding-like beta-propeller repeat protein [Frigoriglobus tundricola]